MHNGSRAFCFLMALAATGAECASAATVPIQSAPYRVAAEAVTPVAAELPTVVVANHVLAVIAVSHALASPGAESVQDASQVSQPVANAPATVLALRSFFSGPTAACVYDADGRVMASLADANERQLLFVKITRG